MKKFALVSLLLFPLLAFGCAETTTTPPAKQIIEDLAYMQIMPTYYTDDADPEPEGFAIDIIYYNSKSAPINFSNIPIEVIIEIYAYPRTWSPYDYDKMEFIYTKQATVHHSMKLSEMFGSYIRNPFETLPVDRSKYYERGTIKITVVTPQQGDFQETCNQIRLYPSAPEED